MIRLDASNKNLLQFQEFVRAAERRDKWKELEMREKTLEENRKRRELEEREKVEREEEERAKARAKEKRAIEEMREVMTRMRKNIDAPAETDTMAAAGTDTMAAAENETTAGTARREQGTKTTEVREERGWKDDVRWRHTWVRQSKVLERSELEQTAGDREPNVVRDKRHQAAEAGEDGLARDLHVGGRGRSRARGGGRSDESSWN